MRIIYTLLLFSFVPSFLFAQMSVIDTEVNASSVVELTEFNIYPNPSSEFINTEVNSTYKIEEVEIYSLLENKISTHISN